MDLDEMETSDVLKIQDKFRKAHKELDHIRVKVNMKKGILFFKRHVYTIEELLRSEHHKKVYAITEKIGDDAMHWYKAGKLTDGGRRTYYESKRQVEDELHAINLQIETREPTWWEKISEAFTAFVAIIAQNMPDLARAFLDKIANRLALPALVRKVLGLPVVQTRTILLD